MILTKDNLKLGLVLGLLGPLVGLLAVYKIKFPSYGLSTFLDYLLHDNKLLTSVGTLSLLANALLFAIYVQADKYQTFKGIFIITLVYGVGILMIKLFN
ncbi:MAG: hypothetical protein RJA57_1346 [Bacteroidota bacterium]|jgi:hypothetical protein